MWIVEINDVDGRNTGLLQRNVIVNDRLTRGIHEHVPIADGPGGIPHVLDHIGCPNEGVALLGESLVQVGHQVEQDGVAGSGSLGKVIREVPRSDEHVVLLGEDTVVLAVHQQEIHTGRGWQGSQRVGDAEEHGDPRPAVVGARHGGVFVGRLRAIGLGPGVPVGQEQDSGGCVQVEPAQDITHRERVTRARDVQPVLQHDRIRPFPHEAVEPTTRRLVLRCSGNSGPEGHLGLYIGESLSPIERTGRCLVALAGHQQRGGEGQK